MCLTFVMLKANAAPDEWQLILINNRDEDFNRPTEKAHWDGHILCRTNGGTWLGISRRGRIGVLMNIMEPTCSAKTKFSRGNLVKEYLQSACDPLCYLQEVIIPDAQKYSGFSNRGIESFFTGVYGYGNSVPDLPFLKVKRGLQRFENILQSQGAHYEIAVQKRLSRCFYDLLPHQEYGTRTHSIILIDGSGRVLFVEENRCALGESWTREKFAFELC
ncbi:Transport and Golgi organization protein 2 [Trichinella pseudospiralis]|uniref:Transport and Golgi organization protein 2 n=1 Tax=Trichinella pseudospiralis TaxID=6337 RepID=A0A0V0XTA4_TRIPS|nr:Transport and Golgi organization protein 2 [Trichinella pseudospiralis]